MLFWLCLVIVMLLVFTIIYFYIMEYIQCRPKDLVDYIKNLKDNNAKNSTKRG